MVIVSAGVRPNIQLARQMGIETSRTGSWSMTGWRRSMEGVFAAGDVAEHRGRVYGIWPAAQRQGEIAGSIWPEETPLYTGTTVSNTLKVVGIDLTSIGEIDAERKLECVVRSDREKCTYCKSAFKEDKIVGCILLGEVKGKNEILNAIEQKVDVKSIERFHSAGRV